MQWTTGASPGYKYRTPLDSEEDVEKKTNKVITFGSGSCDVCRKSDGEIHDESCIMYDPLPDVLITPAPVRDISGYGFV